MFESPHVTTWPPLFTAANALKLEYTEVTPDASALDTVEELPPQLGSPHVTTLPSLFTAAKARLVEYTAVMFDASALDTVAELPPRPA